MRYCPNCETQTARDSIYCCKCGEPLKENAWCVCGYQLTLDDKYCEKCGRIKPQK